MSPCGGGGGGAVAAVGRARLRRAGVACRAARGAPAASGGRGSARRGGAAPCPPRPSGGVGDPRAPSDRRTLRLRHRRHQLHVARDLAGVREAGLQADARIGGRRRRRLRRLVLRATLHPRSPASSLTRQRGWRQRVSFLWLLDHRRASRPCDRFPSADRRPRPTRTRRSPSPGRRPGVANSSCTIVIAPAWCLIMPSRNRRSNSVPFAAAEPGHLFGAEHAGHHRRAGHVMRVLARRPPGRAPRASAASSRSRRAATARCAAPASSCRRSSVRVASSCVMSTACAWW